LLFIHPFPQFARLVRFGSNSAIRLVPVECPLFHPIARNLPFRFRPNLVVAGIGQIWSFWARLAEAPTWVDAVDQLTGH
jgi:hypothetical protein